LPIEYTSTTRRGGDGYGVAIKQSTPVGKKEQGARVYEKSCGMLAL
jgi:hypothetical protein